VCHFNAKKRGWGWEWGEGNKKLKWRKTGWNIEIGAMANLIPDIDPSMIENKGERRFYRAAMELPDDYTVVYSFKFTVSESKKPSSTVYEADFIIIHPRLGFVTVEVKQGDYKYEKNRWFIFLGQGYVPADKDPVEQARRTMYRILDGYKQEARKGFYPLDMCYAVCFPDCYDLSGNLPAHLSSESVILAKDLEDLHGAMQRIFGDSPRKPHENETNLLINRVLAPSFQVFTALESQIEAFEKKSERLLTDEQERILDETEMDRRKVFLGGGGTGKTFISMEKTRRLVADGKKVLLTCFNKNLGSYFRKELADELATGRLTATNFHDFLVQILDKYGVNTEIPREDEERNRFFKQTLPEEAFDLFVNLSSEEKFDSLVVDEGQDFHEEWFSVLESALKGGEEGEFYVFADLYQSLFNPETDFIKKLPVSKHRLVRNLRNTACINDWVSALLPEEARLKCKQEKGLPVVSFKWETPGEECKLVEKEVGRLVSQGINPQRIVILSPHVKERSSFAEREYIKNWPLGQIDDLRPNTLRFCTIRSFKGLESPIVFLTGVQPGTRACTMADVYVGASRARFLLYVFYHQDFLWEGK